MRPISEKRQFVEGERHEHTVKRGRRGWFHFENMPWIAKTFKFFVRMMRLRQRGYRNALDIRAEKIDFEFENLPAAFGLFFPVRRCRPQKRSRRGPATPSSVLRPPPCPRKKTLELATKSFGGWVLFAGDSFEQDLET